MVRRIRLLQIMSDTGELSVNRTRSAYRKGD